MSDMARYIDADCLLEQISKKKCEVGKTRYIDGFNDGLMRIRSMISTAPTADVVPKSEVERLRKTLSEYEETSGLKQAKAEVAREIFEEIETALNLYKCYGDSGIYYEYYLEADLAELKKKYTEEKT